MRRARLRSDVMMLTKGPRRALFSWARRGAIAKSWMNPMRPSRQGVFGGFSTPSRRFAPPSPARGRGTISMHPSLVLHLSAGSGKDRAMRHLRSKPSPDFGGGLGGGICRENASQFPCVKVFRRFSALSGRAIAMGNSHKEAPTGVTSWI